VVRAPAALWAGALGGGRWNPEMGVGRPGPRRGQGREPLVRLGGNFELDGDLAEQIQDIPGISRVSLRAKPAGARLRLVA